MNETQERQFESDFETFILRPEWVAYASLPALDLLIERTRERVEANGGYSSVSAFEISFRQLAEADEIQKLRPIPDFREEVEQAFTLTAQEYRQMPARVIQLKYRNDASFRAQVDSLIERGLI